MEIQFQPLYSFTGALNWCESTLISDTALTVFTLKAAAVCTVHLSHNRSDSSSIWIICKNPYKDLSCSVLILLGVNEPMASAKNHTPCSAWHLMEIRKWLKCLEGFLKVFDLTSATESFSSLLSLVLVYYHEY